MLGQFRTRLTIAGAVGLGIACGTSIDTKVIPGTDPDGGQLPDGATRDDSGIVTPACSKAGDMPFVWAKHLATNAYLKGAAALADGTLLVTGDFGNTSKPATFGVFGPGGTVLNAMLDTYDAFVAKYDASGTLQWAKRAGGTDADHGFGVAIAADGSSRVIGTFRGTAVFAQGEAGEKQLTTTNVDGLFVAKYANDGSLAWVKGTTGSGTAKALTVKTAADGSTLVLGHIEGTLTFGSGEAAQTTLTSTASYDADRFIAKYDDAGSLLWAKILLNIPTFASIAVRADGQFMLGGSSGSVPGTTLAVGEPNETKIPNGTGTFYAKYGSDGKLNSVLTTSGPQSANVNWLADGTVLVVGTMKGNVTFGKGEANETAFDVASGTDPFFAKYAENGALLFAKRAGTGGREEVGLAGSPSADGSFRAIGTYGASDPNFTIGAGELGAVKLPVSGCAGTDCEIPFLANFATDGKVVSAKRLSKENPRMIHLSETLTDSSFRVVGTYSRTTSFGEGETGAMTLQAPGGAAIWAARYNVCP